MAIKKYEKLSLIIGGPGIIVYIIGFIVMHNNNVSESTGVMILLCGIISLGVGLGMAAKSKGHSMILGVLGILGLIGLIILALLKDKYPAGYPPSLPSKD